MTDPRNDRDVVARAPLYVVLPVVGDVEELSRFQGALFARLDYLSRTAVPSSESWPLESEFEVEMLKTALGYLAAGSLQSGVESLASSGQLGALVPGGERSE